MLEGQGRGALAHQNDQLSKISAFLSKWFASGLYCSELIFLFVFSPLPFSSAVPDPFCGETRKCFKVELKLRQAHRRIKTLVVERFAWRFPGSCMNFLVNNLLYFSHVLCEELSCSPPLRELALIECEAIRSTWELANIIDFNLTFLGLPSELSPDRKLSWEKSSA